MKIGESVVEVTTIAQLSRLTDCGAEFHAAGKIPGRFIPKVWVKNWGNLLAIGRAKVWGLFDTRTGEGKGALGCLLYNDLNDDELVASEAFWFVREQDRKLGMRLFRVWENWLPVSGAKRATMVYLFKFAPERMAKIYAKYGYVPTEVHSIKEIC